MLYFINAIFFPDQAQFRSFQVFHVLEDNVVEGGLVLGRGALIKKLLDNISITLLIFALLIENEEDFFVGVLMFKIVVFKFAADFFDQFLGVELSSPVFVFV